MVHNNLRKGSIQIAQDSISPDGSSSSVSSLSLGWYFYKNSGNVRIRKLFRYLSRQTMFHVLTLFVGNNFSRVSMRTSVHIFLVAANSIWRRPAVAATSIWRRRSPGFEQRSIKFTATSAARNPPRMVTPAIQKVSVVCDNMVKWSREDCGHRSVKVQHVTTITSQQTSNFRESPTNLITLLPHQVEERHPWKENPCVIHV